MDLVHFFEIPVSSPRSAQQLEARIVAQAFISDETRRHVDPESIDPAIEPEAHDVLDRGAHVLVPPVEARLLRQGMVQVVLAGLFIGRPRAPPALEDRAPVVRWAASPRSGPDVEVPV